MVAAPRIVAAPVSGASAQRWLLTAVAVMVVTAGFRFLTLTGFPNDHFTTLTPAWQMAATGDLPIGFSGPGPPVNGRTVGIDAGVVGADVTVGSDPRGRGVRDRGGPHTVPGSRSHRFPPFGSVSGGVRDRDLPENVQLSEDPDLRRRVPGVSTVRRAADKSAACRHGRDDRESPSCFATTTVCFWGSAAP